MFPSFLGWGYFWRPFDIISIRLLDIEAKDNLRLQSQRDRRAAAAVGAPVSVPEKPRPPCAVYKSCYRKLLSK